MKKVLSIDYDYFQNVSLDILKGVYPDGIDLPTDISNAIWKAKYKSDEICSVLNGVTLISNELALAEKILTSQQTDTVALVASSHESIYDFIHDNFSEREKLLVVNADMHHDFFNDQTEMFVDCGNWLGHIHKEWGKNFYWKWIMNPVTNEMYGLTKGTDEFPVTVSLNEIQDMKFDAVFLCRSDPWTPPHLDYGFEHLLDIMTEHFDNIEIEEAVRCSRLCMPQMKGLKT